MSSTHCILIHILLLLSILHLLPLTTSALSEGTVAKNSSTIERRSFTEETEENPSLIKSFLPLRTPIRSPIKKLFKTLFKSSPTPESIQSDDNFKATYFVSPKMTRNIISEIASPKSYSTGLQMAGSAAQPSYSAPPQSVGSKPQSYSAYGQSSPYNGYNSNYYQTSAKTSPNSYSNQPKSIAPKPTPWAAQPYQQNPAYSASNQAPSYPTNYPQNSYQSNYDYPANSYSQNNYQKYSPQNSPQNSYQSGYQSNGAYSKGTNAQNYNNQNQNQLGFSFGDPANGRGVTMSVGDETGKQYSNNQYNYQNSNYGSAGSDGSGVSYGDSSGGSGITLGGGDGGGGEGMSFSFGGGSGMKVNVGSGGGGYQSSGYGQQGYGDKYGGTGNSYGKGYDNSYGNSYGGYGNYGKKYYYEEKPQFSLTMPSMGKMVAEMNMRPPTLKMKVNASPKMKIITGTTDPLEKPSQDEEPIMEDIFAPPAPFERPPKMNDTDNNQTMNGMNGTAPHQPYPYPYPPYPYPYPYPYPNPYPTQHSYPHQYPGNGQSGYGQQYTQPFGTQSYAYPQPQSSYSSPSYPPNSYHQNSGYNPNAHNYQQNYYKNANPGYGHQTKSYGTQPQTHYDKTYSSESKRQNVYVSPKSRDINKIQIQTRRNQYVSNPVPNESYGHQNPNYYHYSHQNGANHQNSYYNYVPYSNGNTNNIPNYYNHQPHSYGQAFDYHPNQTHGTGVGFNYYNNGSYTGAHLNQSYAYQSQENYRNYYNNYYKNYYQNYYNNYYDYYKNKSKYSISGYHEDHLDYELSKTFGKMMEKYPGGSTKEEKSQVVFDIRPRVTFKMHNRSQPMEKHHKDPFFKTKFMVIMETTTKAPDYGYGYGGYGSYASTTSSTTPKPSTTTTTRRTTTTEAPDEGGDDEEDNDNGDEGGGDEDEEENADEETTSTTTTTTTESPDSGEGEEENEDEDQPENEETSSTTTTTTTTESPEEEEEEREPQSEANGSTDQEEADGEAQEEDVDNENDDESSSSQIDGTKTRNRNISNGRRNGKTPKNKENGSNGSVFDDQFDSNTENSESENCRKKSVCGQKGNKDRDVTTGEDDQQKQVTVPPELLSVMMKALQEALVKVNPSEQITAKSMAETSTEESKDVESGSNENDDEQEEDEEDILTTTTTTERPKQTGIDKNTIQTRDKSKKTKTTNRDSMVDTLNTRRKLIPTIISAIVTNTTSLRLKSPVLSVLSRTTPIPLPLPLRPSTSGTKSIKRTKADQPFNQKDISQQKVDEEREPTDEEESDETDEENENSVPTVDRVLSTSKPFIDETENSNRISDNNNNNSMTQIMSNFNIDDLTDDERKRMLLNIFNVIQTKSDSNVNKISDSEKESKSSDTNGDNKSDEEEEEEEEDPKEEDSNENGSESAPKVRIVSTIDELSSAPHDPKNPPIFVVLLPEEQKKNN